MAPSPRKRLPLHLLFVAREAQPFLPVRRVLRDAGFRVTPVPTKREALRYLRQGGPADLVVLGPGQARDGRFQEAVVAVRPSVRVWVPPRGLRKPRDWLPEVRRLARETGRGRGPAPRTGNRKSAPRSSGSRRGP